MSDPQNRVYRVLWQNGINIVSDSDFRRPDNWVFVDAVQTVDALPAPPPLAVSENAVREMPRPLRPFGG